jgi:hypothetical protein
VLRACADPGDHRDEERLRRSNLCVQRLLPADECFLQHVLGIGNAASIRYAIENNTERSCWNDSRCGGERACVTHDSCVGGGASICHSVSVTDVYRRLSVQIVTRGRWLVARRKALVSPARGADISPQPVAAGSRTRGTNSEQLVPCATEASHTLRDSSTLER